MSLFGDMSRKTPDPDVLWQALADSTRRRLVELLAAGPQTTGALATRFSELSRTSVMKHLALLQAAGLVRVARAGRTRWNQLDPAPLRTVCQPWVVRHARKLAGAMQQIKQAAESLAAEESRPAGRASRKPAKGRRS